MTFDMKLISQLCSVFLFSSFIECGNFDDCYSTEAIEMGLPCVDSKERNENDILKVLKNKLGYDDFIARTLFPPDMNTINNRSGEAIDVSVEMFLRNIEYIDEINMEMKVQVTFRMEWRDPRLSYYDVVSDKNIRAFGMIKLVDTSKIWIPDVFFANEKESHEYNLIRPNMFVRIFPTGLVLFSQRISLTLSCPMNLKLYPHDSQICPIRIATYQSVAKDVSLRWKSENPVQITKNLHLAKYTLTSWNTSETFINTTTGRYKYLQLNLSYEREFFYHFKKFYLPVVIVFLISLIPLWLERVLIMRIYISLSTVIFLGWYCTIQDPGLLISYNVALNTWNAANFIFVFLAALETTGVVFMIKMNKNAMKRTHPDDNDEFKMLPFGPDKRTVLEIADEKTNIDAEVMKIKTNFKICFVNVHKEVQIIDAAAKLFFPSAYILFLFFYWITYVNN